MPLSKQRMSSIVRTPKPALATILAFLLSLPLIYLLKIPQNDVASRYAPMAEAFAAGQWGFAFHPRVPPLHTVTAGLFAAGLNVNGFTATQLASALFFALGILPFYGLLRKVFSSKAAFTGIFLYLFCAPWLELAYSGLRDSAKGFLLLLAMYGAVSVFQHLGKWNGYLWTAIGSAGLALTRGDCLLYALLLLGAIFLMELRQSRTFRFPLRSLIAAALFSLLIAPWLQYQYNTIGYPVTAVQQVSVLKKIESHFGITLPFQAPVSSAATAQPPGHKPSDEFAVENTARPPSTEQLTRSPVASLPRVALPQIVKEHTLREFLKSLTSGFYPPFAILALPVIFYRIRKKIWTALETLLLTTVLLHAILQVGQIALADRILYVSSRYLISATPLYFGWAALGLNAAYPIACRYLRSPKRVNFIIISLLTGLYLHAGGRVIRSFTSGKKRVQQHSILSSAAWIKTRYPAAGTFNHTRSIDPHRYQSGRSPVVLSSEPSVGFFSHGQVLDLNQPIQNLKLFCANSGVDFLVLYPHEAERIGLDESLAGFISNPGKYGMRVFDLRP
jgi:4-amino-4-deoxy-L-arabinose transferase-like glycosyltransferase